jgi:hypothetical protein
VHQTAPVAIEGPAAGTETDERRLTGRERALVATLCGAQVLEVLGVTVVIVALPVIGADLGLGGGRLQLVVSLYAVLYGGLLLTPAEWRTSSAGGPSSWQACS